MTSFLRLLAVLACLAVAPPLAAQEAPVAADGVAADGVAADGGAAGSGLETLLGVLRDDAARAELIAELEAALAEEADAGAAPDEEGGPVAPLEIGRQLAETTQALAEEAAESAGEVWRGLGRARAIMSTLNADTWAAITDALIDLLLVISVTAGVFILLRRIMNPVYGRIGAFATASTPLVALTAGSAAAVADALLVVLAWAVGFVVTTAVFGEFGQIGLRQTLYLNAFLAVELAKVAAGVIVAPATASLRILPVSDLAARRLSRVTNIVVSLLGYGQLLVVPIISTSTGYFAGRAVAAVIACLAVLYLVAAVLRYRADVGQWLVERLLPWRRRTTEERESGLGETEALPREGDAAPALPETGPAPATAAAGQHVRVPADGPIAGLFKLWYLPAIFFLAYVLYEALTRPIEDVVGTLLASLRIGAAVIAGILIARVLASAMERGVRLPAHVNDKIPLLESRINALVPRIFAGLRIIVIGLVIAFSLETMGLFSAFSWLGSASGQRLIGTLLVVATILIVAYAIWVAFSSWVDYRLNPDYSPAPSSRETTLLTLLRNAVTVALLILTLMITLSELGLNIGPLIASAGVLGLAIGFGAQKLVQDIITGVFIQFENAINVGDVVTVGGTTGAVEKLTVRSVTLRDLQGIVHIVPFSSVDMVSNFTREFSFYVVDMGIAYREDVDEAKQAMFDAYELLREDPEQGAFLLGDLEYFGLNAFGDSAVVLRARVKTWPGKQWGVGRAYNGYLKTVFDERGIEIPFPHQTLFFGEAKDGTIQTLPIRQSGEKE